jgi:hypothetical protein
LSAWQGAMVAALNVIAYLIAKRRGYFIYGAVASASTCKACSLTFERNGRNHDFFKRTSIGWY